MATKTAAYHRIAIIGSGNVGIALAKQLVSVGHQVTFSNSRGPETLQKEGKETGAKPTSVEDGIVGAKFVILATPMASIVRLAQDVHGLLSPGTILIDTCNYYPSRDGQIQEIDSGLLDSVWVSQQFPRVPVVKALNNIIAANMVTSARASRASGRVTLPVSADDSNALEAVMTLVNDIGFDTYNAGPLTETWRYQPGQPAYCTEPNRQQLIRLLAKADRERGPKNRDSQRALLEKLPDGYSPRVLLRVGRLSAGLDTWNLLSWIAAVELLFALARGSVTTGRT